MTDDIEQRARGMTEADKIVKAMATAFWNPSGENAPFEFLDGTAQAEYRIRARAALSAALPMLRDGSSEKVNCCADCVLDVEEYFDTLAKEISNG